jgi:hypothetical protein
LDKRKTPMKTAIERAVTLKGGDEGALMTRATRNAPFLGPERSRPARLFRLRPEPIVRLPEVRPSAKLRTFIDLVVERLGRAAAASRLN